MLLSIEQLWIVHPDVMALYPDSNTLVIDEGYTIKSSDVISLREPCTIVVKVENNILLPLHYEVMNLVNYVPYSQQYFRRLKLFFQTIRDKISTNAHQYFKIKFS